MENEILELANKHGLVLQEDSLTFINMGLDFQVVFGTDATEQVWVLRIPRREDAMEKVQAEKNILDLVTQLSSKVQTPNWEIFTDKLIAYKKLEGQPAVTTNMDTQETTWLFDETNVPKNYRDSLAEFLVALHRLPIEKAEAAGLSVELGIDLRESMQVRMKQVNKQYEIHPKLWKRWQNWLEDETMWPEETGFIHGDLFPGHTLVDEEHTITGIIDWTEAKVSDISNDFTAYYMLFGEYELDQLLSAYDAAGGYTWPKMKEHIIELLSTQGITLAEFAMSSGLEEYKQIAQEVLSQSE